MTFFEDNFFMVIRSTVTKWWRVIYKPVYKLANFKRSNTNQEVQININKETTNTFQDNYINIPENTIVPSTSTQYNDMNFTTNTVDPNEILNSIRQKKDSSLETIISTAKNTNVNDFSEELQELGDSKTSDDALLRAKEIMDRLNKEADDDNAKKQAEIEEAKQKAHQMEVVYSVMNQNKLDISSFIDSNNK